MERPLINERSSKAEQNLHAWLSQLFAISCDDVVNIRHRQAYINISNKIQIAPIEAETRELLSKLKCVNRWLKTEIELLTSTAVEFAQTYPDRMISTRRRLDNTTTEVSSDSNASSRLVNITTDTSVSATDSLVAPQEPTEVIDLETSPVPKESMRIEGTTPPTRPAEMSTPNSNARHRRELKRLIEAEETPVSKRTQRPVTVPKLSSGGNIINNNIHTTLTPCSASNDSPVPQGHPQPQPLWAPHDHAQMMDNLTRAMGVRLNRMPTQGRRRTEATIRQPTPPTTLQTPPPDTAMGELEQANPCLL
ncbi:unnamed protein product [Lepeophtheirus salmonis]|uniref:(salmon louse) hypothetical protein n=1 Tax=Lepeophtheirus salmonis TaxID=72036 RepID=A0A7R8HDD1_LEPSM|nr:unnamed protein product [Lepeophtheirus salmonis]CAF3031708.1 unnamed protein product [Lepeophtheirus salmonis]